MSSLQRRGPASGARCRLRFVERGKPPRWLSTGAMNADGLIEGGVTEKAEEAHVAPFATLHALARLMRDFARRSGTPLQFIVEDAP